MKKLCIAVCFMAAAAALWADPIWVKDGTVYGTSAIRDIQMFNDSTGWAVGDNGLVYKRERYLHPLPSQNAWVQKTDLLPGGWQGWYNFKGVCFADESHGWIVGYCNSGPKKYRGIVLRTNDGGTNWTSVVSDSIQGLRSTPDSLTPFIKVSVSYYNNRYTGFVSCGNGYILRLEANGTWTPIRPSSSEHPESETRSSWFKDLWTDPTGTYIQAIADNTGGLVSSVDGGLHWDFTNSSVFDQQYVWPLNTQFNVAPKIANLCMSGEGPDDCYLGSSFSTMYRMQDGALSQYHYFGTQNYQYGNDNWTYGIIKGLGDTLFACGNNRAIWKVDIDSIENTKWDGSPINCLDIASHGYAGSSNGEVLHRYEPAQIAGFTVDRIDDSTIQVTFTSAVESNLAYWRICASEFCASDVGNPVGGDLTPAGVGSVYTRQMRNWIQGVSDTIEKYFTLWAYTNDNKVVYFGPEKCLVGASNGMGLPVNIIDASDVPDDNGHRIKVSWQPAMKLVQLMRSEYPAGPWYRCASGGDNAPCSTLTDEQVPLNDRTYYYCVQYFDSLWGVPSAPYAGVARDNITPDAIPIDTITYSHVDSTLTIKWSPLFAGDLGGYWLCPEPLGVFGDKVIGDPGSYQPDAYHVEHSSPLERTVYKYRVPEYYLGQTLGFSVAVMDRSGHISPWSSTYWVNTRVFTNSSSPQATAYNNARHLLYDNEGKLVFTYNSDDSVCIQKSDNDGYTWTTGVRFASGGVNPAPALGFDGNDTNIVWKAETELSGWILKGVNKNGDTWGAPFVIDEQPGGWDQAHAISPPAIVMDASGTHMAVERRDVTYTPGGQSGFWTWALRYGFCPKGTTTYTWTDLDTSSGSWHHEPPDRSLASPTICFDAKGCLHVAWDADSEVWWMMRNTAGQWLAKQNLSNSPDVVSAEPSLSSYGDVHLVWQEGNDVAHRKGNYGQLQRDAGLPYLKYSWCEAEDVSKNPGTASLNPVFDGGYAAWSEETRPGQYNAYLSSYDGIAWSLPQDFSKNPSQPSVYPQIACRQADGASKMTTVWTEGTGPLYSLIARDATGQVTPVFAADLGGEQPSVYTIQRDGYLTCTYNGNPITVDYDTTELQYYLPTLDPNQQQSVAIGFYVPAAKGSAQYKVYVDDVPLGVVNIGPGEYVDFEKSIPNSVCHDGEGVLRIENKQDAIVACDRFRLYNREHGAGKDCAQQTAVISTTVAYCNELSQNAPNPCADRTTFLYQLARSGQVTLKVYNTLGQVVKTLVNGDQQAGIHNISWNSRDDQGRQVATGVYIYRICAAGYSETRKLVLVR
ncbi:MAG: T9SS type A sorting domain-containing protein [Rhodocyclaceae bacterium]|nr:T9SS type A sorting domain-containing protein [Rhodocyclaceae bacterium]